MKETLEAAQLEAMVSRATLPELSLDSVTHHTSSVVLEIYLTRLLLDSFQYVAIMTLFTL